jgi:hypothetical protein
MNAAATGAVSEDRGLPNETVIYFSWSMKLAETGTKVPPIAGLETPQDQ